MDGRHPTGREAPGHRTRPTARLVCRSCPDLALWPGQGFFRSRPASGVWWLDVCRYGNTMAGMARAATTSDAFNAIAEPQRREILGLLRAGERAVTDVAREL